MYDLLVLMAALKQVKRPNLFLWNLFVRGTVSEDTGKFEVQLKKSRRQMAPFVGKYENGVVLEKDGATVKEFEPGHIKPIRRAEANELLEKQFGGTPYGNSVDPEERADNQIAKELKELDTAIVRTELWMLAQMLTKGQIPVIGKSINRALKYGSSSDNFEILSGADMWSNSLSDPLKFLEEKQIEILKNTGIRIDAGVFTPSAAAAFMEHPKIKSILTYTTADVLRIAPRDLGDGASYLGTIPKLNIDIYQYIDWAENPETNAEEPLIPEGGIILGKAGSVEVHYGAIPQIPWGEQKRQLFVGSRIPKYYVENDNEMVRLASAPFPMPDDVDGFAYAKVV